MSAVIDAWRTDAAACGLDLLAPFSVSRARAELGTAVDLLPDFGRREPLGVVVGNTRAAWPVFREAFGQREALQQSADPFDAWVEAAVADLSQGAGVETFVALAHDPHRRLPIQRIGELAGLAQLGPAHLSVHPRHGPWISLRAVVVLDIEAVAVAAPSPRPCEGCSAPCVEALEAALAAGTPTRQSEVAARWRDWVAVRDACPVGRDARFSDEQVEYHYRQDRALLLGG